jgi:hypothetical protein
MAIYVKQICFAIDQEYFVERDFVCFLFEGCYGENFVVCVKIHWLELQLSDVFESELDFGYDRVNSKNGHGIFDTSAFLFGMKDLLLEADFLILKRM